METVLENTLLVLPVFADPLNLCLLVGGVAAGILVGAVPGFTVTMALVLFLPFTFNMSAQSGLITMLGILVGGMSGGLIGAILTGIPGTPASIATTFDGFPMARQGRMGHALGLGVWSSFGGGVIGTFMLLFLAPSISMLGLEFGPWDFFALIFFALTIAGSLSGKSLSKGLVAAGFGLLTAAVGYDPINGVPRLTFGIESLGHGFQVLPVLVGLFGFGQIMTDWESTDRAQQPLALENKGRIRIEHMAAIREILRQWGNLVRSSLLGVFIGAVPAVGGQVANILAWDQAKKASSQPERFGTGIPEGIVAPESANNATSGGSLAILMALGIPGDVVTVVLLGALIIHDVAPSPTFVSDRPDIAYTILLAYFFAHFVMVCLQAFGLRVFTIIGRAPNYFVGTIIIFCAAIGVFVWDNAVFDIWTVFLFGMLGYTMRCLDFPAAPFILGSVLGSVAELNLNRALATSDNLMLFLTRPWSLLFLILAVFSAAYPVYEKYKGQRLWTHWYVPGLCLGAGAAFVLMGGWVRPSVGIVLTCFAAYSLWRKAKAGIRLWPGGRPAAG